MSEASARPDDRDRAAPDAVAGLRPRHIAIVMDGNHRWARARRLPGAAGHRAGARCVRPVAEACAAAGVEALTLFAFSTENWNRPSREVSLLMDLLKRMLADDLTELDQRDIRVRIIGERERFAPDIQAQMAAVEERTAGNGGMFLQLACSYGGRWDLVQAVRALATEVQAGTLDPTAIDEASVAAHLSLAGLPAPDLCIRTGGEQRISNFLLWDFAYTEFFFTDTYWPDFDAARLDEAIEAFAHRQRRYGGR